MIGLDTNILVRWLVLPGQADLASSDAELEQIASVVNAEGASLFINVVVVAETVWIMEKKLGLGRDVVSAIVNRLLLAENITLGNDLEMRAALLLYTSSSIGFVDCLIAKLNLAAGCVHTLTFDRKASRTEGFRHVDDR